MFGKSKHPEVNVLFVRDADLATEALRRALADASPEERPGLELALALRLDAVGYGGPADSVQAIKHLREAAPGLSLGSAVQLAKSAAAQGA
ncbi:hypothetical protein SSP24_55880 [Streptomyces spinoverrucosus]|uniref:Uncharacterized protein n=1 Tax=Streptomyces spinoverrucosus TaxID=284043 RepID=A0A4Y3VMY7_9ACTN|nr:hypothetical protein [Streptomyces spinoverrucosus]GEC07933.1 hypothetical protein SSP24_55880 [Streptomyces spinoverrucosus]GHB85895.1 hypothetical protein GCM10010397_66660 [Streptomyces spinoverrucosus]